MTRIPPICPDCDCPEFQSILKSVKQSIGAVPNLVATLAQSPAAAKAYLGFSQSLSTGLLDSQLRERIALTVGEANSCNYCLSAHSMLGAKAGLCKDEIRAARRATSADAKIALALDFVRKLVVDRGQVSDSDLSRLREVGYSHGEITEIVAHVALNLFTNYFNHVAATEIDFPLAESLA